MLFQFRTHKGRIIAEINASNKREAREEYKKMLADGIVRTHINSLKVIDVAEEKKFQDEMKKIEDIVFKIHKEFDVEVKLLSRPTTVKEAWKLYYSLREEQQDRGNKF